jgi:hypothetical protein
MNGEYQIQRQESQLNCEVFSESQIKDVLGKTHFFVSMFECAMKGI